MPKKYISIISKGGENLYLKDAEAREAISQIDISAIQAKADKVSGATSGNFAALDANGNLVDSGKSHSTYSGKADKVSSATNNNLAALNSNGNLKDSGYSVDSFVLVSSFATVAEAVEAAEELT